MPKDQTSAVFKSVAVRDPLGGVSQELKVNPGPGTYLTQQMKLIKPETSTKLA